MEIVGTDDKHIGVLLTQNEFIYLAAAMGMSSDDEVERFLNNKCVDSERARDVVKPSRAGFELYQSFSSPLKSNGIFKE
jgi:hypothetical protein